jgi:hypothetical protein
VDGADGAARKQTRLECKTALNNSLGPQGRTGKAPRHSDSIDESVLARFIDDPLDLGDGENCRQIERRTPTGDARAHPLHRAST